MYTIGTGRPDDPYRYTLSPVCMMCRKEVPQVLAWKHFSICFNCAGAVAQAYLEELPKHLEERLKEKVDRQRVKQRRLRRPC
jgi:hypothetical protein